MSYVSLVAEDSVVGEANDDPFSNFPRPSVHPCEPAPMDHYVCQLRRILETSKLPFALFYRASLDAGREVDSNRSRDLLPLPLPCCQNYSQVLSGMVMLAVVGLNFLHAGNIFAASCLPPHGEGTASQRLAIVGIIEKCKRLESRLHEHGESTSPEAALSHFCTAEGSVHPELVAEFVDLPTRSATCNPSNNIDPLIARTISNPDFIFPEGPPRTPSARCPAASRTEYVRLIGRQLLCGKLRLRSSAYCSAPIFVVAKKGGNRLREVWSGDVISAAAIRPPRPRRLGNPSVFTKIVKAKNAQLHFSKRDAKTYFDLLCLPENMRPYFGRPRVNLGKLAECMEVAIEDLRVYLDGCETQSLRSSMYVAPVSVTWPMGFSWSSFVAQEQMTTVCRTAGLEEHQLLCLEAPCPIGCDELVTVATDDVVFMHTSADVATSRLETFEAALLSYDIEKNDTKDVDCAAEVTALGVHLSNSPPWVEADIGKLSSLLAVFVEAQTLLCSMLLE